MDRQHLNNDNYNEQMEEKNNNEKKENKDISKNNFEIKVKTGGFFAIFL